MKEQLLDLLIRLEEYFDNRADIKDGDDGWPTSNQEMQFLVEIKSVIEAVSTPQKSAEELIEQYEKIFEIKENERKEWADLCIKKQQTIEELQEEIELLRSSFNQLWKSSQVPF